MIKTTAILISELPGYVNPKAKIGRMVEKGEIYPIIRGLYEDDPKTPAFYLAGSIYGPSYISFESALNYYGLITRKDIPLTCAAFGKRKEKRYETMFGTFTYRDIPKKVFSKELILHQENGYSYVIASPEKAFLDTLYNSAPAANLKELKELMFDGIGIGKRKIFRLDPAVMTGLSDDYGCRNIYLLKSFLRKKYGRIDSADRSDN
ncbi:MAG: hypothetical protein IKP86_10300 [Anaerolineaceae bacterium]|nr:hypothetical protein [Anaerolineaceae bacterium]